MNTLPEDIQDTIYKYKHQLGFKNAMDQMKCNVCYCGFCCDGQRTWTICSCDDEWSDDSAFDYASHSEYYDDTDSDSYYPVTTL